MPICVSLKKEARANGARRVWITQPGELVEKDRRVAPRLAVGDSTVCRAAVDAVGRGSGKPGKGTRNEEGGRRGREGKSRRQELENIVILVREEKNKKESKRTLERRQGCCCRLEARRTSSRPSG